MPGDFLTRALLEFRVAEQSSHRWIESRSGAGVRPVLTKDGTTAYLKVTPRAGVDQRSVAAAERELRFYQDLAPVAPVRTPRLLDYMNEQDGIAILLEASGPPQDVG